MNTDAIKNALEIGGLFVRLTQYVFNAIREGHPERVENILPGHYKTELERRLAEAERDAKFGAPA